MISVCPFFQSSQWAAEDHPQPVLRQSDRYLGHGRQGGVGRGCQQGRCWGCRPGQQWGVEGCLLDGGRGGWGRRGQQGAVTDQGSHQSAKVSDLVRWGHADMTFVVDWVLKAKYSDLVRWFPRLLSKHLNKERKNKKRNQVLFSFKVNHLHQNCSVTQ